MSSSSTNPTIHKIPRYSDQHADIQPVPTKPGSINDIHLHHQITQLRFCYLESAWAYEGTTTLFLSYLLDSDLNSSARTEAQTELRFHFRGGSSMKITNVQVATIQPTLDSTKTQQYQPILTNLPVLNVFHADPLAKVLTKPFQTFTPIDFIHENGSTETQVQDKSSPPRTSSNKRRYEADTQYIRGGQGMMDALRCKSIASHVGEVQITFVRPELENTAVIEKDPEWIHKVHHCWKKDLDETSLGIHHTNDDTSSSSASSSLYRELRQRLNERYTKRKEKRLDWICRTLGEETTKVVGEGGGGKKKMALKVTLQFKMMTRHSGSVHVGGIHFHSPLLQDPGGSTRLPSQTPHVYTTVGTIGDHQGTRCWLPTLDTARWNHRCTHEISIAVTAKKEEGLWATGCGEDFGVNDVIMHPAPPSSSRITTDSGNALRTCLMETLGQKQVSLISESLDSASQDNTDSHPVMAYLATSMWVSALWNPAPARSLGMAIAPFHVIYDREYYTKLVDNDEDDNGDGNNIDKRRVSMAFKSAVKKGEGIRQLYFANPQERVSIHKGRTLLRTNDDPRVFKLFGQKQGSLSDIIFFTSLNSIERAIIASTDGVPMRALSLMRGILSLPRFRSSSYTQIWIPRAVDGGSTSGALCTHPEVVCNAFIGGAIFDSSMLHPPNLRLPYYFGGRTCQFLQAQSVVRGWITATVPLGGDDDVGESYIHILFECLLMSLYERAHGGFGEGGGKNSFFYCNRFAKKSGFNSPNMDFLPIYNIEDEGFGISAYHGATGGTQGDDRSNEHLWRSLANGTESHTSALDEFSIRQLLSKDILEGFERADKCLPSMNWLGSYLSATYLSSNSSSSTALGCGAVELVHPSGGVVYRYFKCRSFRRIVEGRCGVSNFVRVVRATIISAILKDLGENKVDILHLNEKDRARWIEDDKDHTGFIPKQPFLVCVDEILKEGGISHNVFSHCLRIISGPLREPYLIGSPHDCSKEYYENYPRVQNLEPEGFPNSYIRASSGLYLRVGAFVEPAVINDTQLQSTTTKGTHLQVIAEPVIPNGGVAFGGQITLRVIENEGQCREFIRSIKFDGARSDWGPIFLHAKPVTTARQQKAASGLIESGTRKAETDDANVDPSASQGNMVGVVSTSSDLAFDSNQLHTGGYQALELIRLTNRTPLLWIRIDPHGWYDGRLSLFIPDACLAEQLFHDGEAASQVDALRALAERPIKIQGSMNMSSVYDVSVSELPVRLLGDCLRGSVALHADLPHDPLIRSHAALAIAQWQNNKAPTSKDAIGLNEWIGLNLLLQYFNERFYRDSSIHPMKYTRISVHGMGQDSHQNTNKSSETTDADEYLYIDSLVEDYNRSYLLEVEEDEEYRVRSSCLKAIACCRAKDGETPSQVIKFFERLLLVNMPTSVKALSLEEEELLKKRSGDDSNIDDDFSCNENFLDYIEVPYSCAHLVAESLLALCFINAKCEFTEHPTTGKRIPSKSLHPCMGLIEACYQWLEWDMYREKRRRESAVEISSGVGGCNVGNISTCAITALCNLTILVQSTSENSEESVQTTPTASDGQSTSTRILTELTHAKFFADILKNNLLISDKISAAAATALVCTYCAADRLKQPGDESIGLLSALELLLQCLLDPRVSPGLRQTLATLMMDACTGKICSTQRVAVAALENDLFVSASRFFCGPLGASYGGDNGGAIFLSVSEATAPVANAVNDGARRGLRLLSRAGQSNDLSEQIVHRVAIFATRLWRTINGELGENQEDQSAVQFAPITSAADGVCAYDGFLRASLLSLWQWIWPKGCLAVMRIQSWTDHEGSQRFKEIHENIVMTMTEEEKEASTVDDDVHSEIRKLVSTELDRQQWRGRTASIAYDLSKQNEDSTTDSTGLNQPLPTIEKDVMWKLGGWIASTSAQRRAAGSDGGTATKIRLIAKPTAS